MLVEAERANGVYTDQSSDWLAANAVDSANQSLRNIGIETFSLNSIDRAIQSREEVTPPDDHEKKTFNVLNYVNLMRYDLNELGYVRPDTIGRVKDEFMTQVVEGIDRSSKSTFILRNDHDGLKYFNEGAWTPYSVMVDNGLEAAMNDAEKDPRKMFLANWAARDKVIASRMSTIKPGQPLYWHSAYPKDVEEQYGKDFLQECGLQPDRQMGFLYRAEAVEGGFIKLESQTVDLSSAAGFEAAAEQAKRNPTQSLESQVVVYDAAVSEEQGGGIFKAGRKDQTSLQNAWTDMLDHVDLIQYATQEFEELARSPKVGKELERAVKKHLYGVWALFSKRITGNAASYANNLKDGQLNEVDENRLRLEVGGAFSEFAKAGRAMIGCGGKITVSKGEEDVLSRDVGDIKSAILGDNESYSYNVKAFCRECQKDPNPPKDQMKNCGPCNICKDCDHAIRITATMSSLIAYASLN
jgi:hypothetical protein